MIDKQTIRDFLIGLKKVDGHIGDNDSLLATKILDSLAVAELIVFLEDHYKVTFNNDDLTPENLDTINAIASFLERKSSS